MNGAFGVRRGDAETAMPNAWEDGARPPEGQPSVLRGALTALPIAIEIFAPTANAYSPTRPRPSAAAPRGTATLSASKRPAKIAPC